MLQSQILGNSWFGKALLGTLALAFADLLVPANLLSVGIVTLLAISLGHQWDLYARHRFSPTLTQASSRQLLAAARDEDPWLVFTFCGMGRLAATDGVVLPAHVQLVEEFMARLGLEGKVRHRAMGWFNAGQEKSAPFGELAQLCNVKPNPGCEALALECFGRSAALRDTPATRTALQGLGSLLQFHRSSRANPDQPNELEAAAELLAVELGESSDAIKLAYRRGVARYHPDRLPAGATDGERQLSQRRMAAFREAYERLLAAADKR
ncbi:MAG: hypothetical protein ACR2PZ_27135 [Pseudomonadales bacterium]